MSAQLLNGKILAQTLKADLTAEVASLQKKIGRVPHMVNVMIGKDHGSCAYANSQKRAANEIGINYELRELESDITQEQLAEQIQMLNADATVDGIMLHKPFPHGLNYQTAANCLDITKDVEGINVANIGKMVLGATKLIPCTPASAMELIAMSKADIRGKEAVIVGHSEIVGKPLALLLLREYATVTVCHIATSEAGKLEEHVGRADILIVAVGKAGLIPGAWIKQGAVVIDVGINMVNNKMVGDVDFEGASKRASFITPVPGGVGPVTVMMLMRNGIESFKLQQAHT